MIITRCAVVDHIENLINRAGTRYFKICFEDGSYAFVERDKFMQKVPAFFGCFGDIRGLKERICGLRIVYCMTFDKRLQGFSPIEDWQGPEMHDGDFLVDCCPCSDWDYRHSTK